MEHGTKISNEDIGDLNFMKYVGWKGGNKCIKKYFSKETVDLISRKITELTLGVDSQNRPIKVPDKNISLIMSSVYDSFKPPTGDIYSRYIIPSGMSPESYIQQMINQTIQIITSQITTTLKTEEYNKSLTIWTTVLGDFNEKGLRSHAPIKIRRKRPNPMQFNMNY
jgi:hypothetical protein